VATQGLVSVIWCNYNGEPIARTLQKGIEAILQQTYPELELILVDDGSTDGSPTLLRKLAAANPRVRLVALRENRGIAAARNAGLAVARGHLIAFLDNDAIPAPDWLAALVQRMQADPTIGACASRVLFADRPDLVDSVGSVLNRLAYGTNVGMYELDEFLELPDEIMYATGNGLILRREALEKVGPFDEGFRHYGQDDSDMGVRLRAAGYRIVPEPRAVVWHRHGYSRSMGGMAFWDERSRIRFALKHYAWREILPFIVSDLRRQQWRFLGDYARAWLSNLQDLAPLLPYRRAHRGAGPFLARMTPFMDSRHGYLVRPDNRGPYAGFAPLDHLRIGPGDEPYLYQGWYSREPLIHTNLWFRWGRRIASLSFHLDEPPCGLEMQILTPPGGGGHLEAQLRRLEGAAWVPAARAEWELAPKPFVRQRLACPGPLSPGDYRLILLSERAHREKGEFPRELGLGLISLAAQ